MAKSKRIAAVSILLLIAQGVFAQNNYYFVSFKDKIGNGYAVTQPNAFLSPKAIDRRVKQGISVQEQDLPITLSYKNTIINQGIEVFESSKWFNGVIIKSTQQKAEQLKNLTFVASITYLAPQNYAGKRSNKSGLLKQDGVSSDSLFQNQILSIDAMHSQGYYGNGITIAILDGGFKNVNSLVPFNHLFAGNQVKYSYDFVSKTDNVYQYSSHGTKVLSLMAAQIDNSYLGIAPKADYLLFVTENIPSEYRIEEYYWLIGAEKADSAGVDVLSTSLGYNTFDDVSMNYTQEDMDGNTTVVSKAAHIATEKGIVVVVSAGNEGNSAWKIILAPADIVNGLAVGSIRSDYLLSSFSSTGPSSDGRIKPDVVALGSQTFLVNENGIISQASGTSFAAPQVAALVAGVWQAYPDFSSLALVEALRMSATEAVSPSNTMGYGIPSFIAVKNYLEATSSTDPVLVYPNPVASDDHVLKVKIANPSKVKVAQIELFETSGKKISTNLYSVSWSNNIANIELGNLTQGLYFLKVVLGSGPVSDSYRVRIIKL